MHSTTIQSLNSQVVQHQSSYKYFKVKVKLGHVSRRMYLPMLLPIRARTLQEAVNVARNHGGVKRDHLNWCLEKPVEISYQEYIEIEAETYNDLYWDGQTRHRLDLFIDRLIDEDDSNLNDLDYHKVKRSKEKKMSNRKDYLLRKSKLDNRIWRHIQMADQESMYEIE